MAYLKKRSGILEAVCVSGGEPTLMPDLESKLSDIKSLGYVVKLDSNGCNPAIIKDLYQKGLIDYVAMDIKNSPEKYAMTLGLKAVDLTPIRKSIDFLMNSGIDYEFRTTVISEFHDDNDIAEIGKLIKGAKRYFLQMYKDSESCIQRGFHAVEKEKVLRWIKILQEDVPSAALRGYE